MKALAEGDETVVLNAKVPRALRDRIDQYQTEHRLANRSEAAREVIERGLDTSTNGDR